MTDKSEKQRLFFALWPDTETLNFIQASTAEPLESVHGRIIKPEKCHFTLAFIGEVDSLTRECLQQAASGVRGQRFKLVLDQLGHWRRPRVVWLAPRETPEALLQLQSDLSLALLECGYQPETRAYKPHMTLMRKANHGPKITEIDPVPMAVSDFVLVCSETHSTGAEYKIIQSWPLGD